MFSHTALAHGAHLADSRTCSLRRAFTTGLYSTYLLLPNGAWRATPHIFTLDKARPARHNELM